MNSKQQALIYLMEEASDLSNLCMRQVHTTRSASQVKIALEQQIGQILSALKETVEEFKLDGERIEFAADREVTNRRAKL